jgi:hypothetical protein
MLLTLALSSRVERGEENEKILTVRGEIFSGGVFELLFM